MVNEDYIHTHDDGRGFDREVFCDGKKLELCVYADTKEGIAICYSDPLRIDKNSGGVAKDIFNGKVVVTNGDSSAVN